METPWHYLAWVLLPARINGGFDRCWCFLVYLHLLFMPHGRPFRVIIISSVTTSRHFIRLKFLGYRPTVGLVPCLRGGHWSSRFHLPIWFSGHPVVFGQHATTIGAAIIGPSGQTQLPAQCASLAKPIGEKILSPSFCKMHIATSCIWQWFLFSFYHGMPGRPCGLPMLQAMKVLASESARSLWLWIRFYWEDIHLAVIHSVTWLEALKINSQKHRLEKNYTHAHHAWTGVTKAGHGLVRFG